MSITIRDLYHDDSPWGVGVFVPHGKTIATIVEEIQFTSAKATTPGLRVMPKLSVERLSLSEALEKYQDAWFNVDHGNSKRDEWMTLSFCTSIYGPKFPGQQITLTVYFRELTPTELMTR